MDPPPPSLPTPAPEEAVQGPGAMLPPPAPGVISSVQGPIAADSYSSADQDNDGAFTDDETQSIRSSVLTYIYENGRRYHSYAEGRYYAPNDENKIGSTFITIFLLLLDGRTHLAPLENPEKILDVGTGTGIWALDIAAQFPEAEVIGTDLSPIQPDMVLPNCRFEIDDAEDDWLYPANHFDYIHSRNLAQSIRDWPRYVKQIHNALKPGGWFELVEVEMDIGCDDDSFPEDCALAQLQRHFREAERKGGISTRTAAEYAQLLHTAGFCQIETMPLKQCWNPWPTDPKNKHIGRVMMLNSETGMEAYSLALLTRVLGMPVPEAKELIRDSVTDSRNRKYHIWTMVDFIVARKPLDDVSV